MIGARNEHQGGEATSTNCGCRGYATLIQGAVGPQGRIQGQRAVNGGSRDRGQFMVDPGRHSGATKGKSRGERGMIQGAYRYKGRIHGRTGTSRADSEG